MSSVLALIAEARRTGDFRALVAAIPYARFLGLELEAREGELWSRLAYSPSIVGNPALPAVHGGALGALLESAAIFELIVAADTVVLPKIITLTVDYLRSAGPTDTWAKGSVTKLGRRVATVHVSAWQEDRARPVASATAHLLVTPPEA